MNDMHVGQVRPVALDALAVGGEAVGRMDGFVCFVEDGAPGDEVEVELTEVRKNFARGRIRRILTPSVDRVTPPCPIYHECAGCQLQHISYERQLSLKTHMVGDALRLAHLADPVPVCGTLAPSGPEAAVEPARETIASTVEAPAQTGAEWGYRTKMQLVAGYKPRLSARKPGEESGFPHEWGGAYLGLYGRHSHNVIRMDNCLIAHPIANRILQAAAHAIERLGWDIYDERSGRGLLRHVLARISASRDEALVVLVATRAQVPEAQQFVSLLRARVPQVVGVLVNVNGQRTNVVLGARTRLLWGRDHIVEDVTAPEQPRRRMAFRVGATSFFQVNVPALEVVAQVVERYLAPRGGETVVDAYCGVGALSLLLANRVRKIVGIEEIPEAVENARQNAAANQVKNADFVCGKVEIVLPQMYRQGERVDAVLLDPPRKGCEPAVLEHIGKLRVARIVYVSCNPATLARDLGMLAGMGYRTEEITPVDMFPQTSHVESVARLRL